jgi:tRNA (guanine10-N2)-dimethyltransferase
LWAPIEAAGVYVLELGGEDDDFAAVEAATAASDVTTIAPGLATAEALSDRIRQLAYTHRASELLARTDPDVPTAVAALEAATLDREGSVAVRAVDVRGATGVDTQRAERELGQVLVDRGFTVDLDAPDHELRALFAEGTAALGWLTAESVRDFGEREPGDRPFFQPGSMSPLLARALANLAGARDGATILDPMCGTGGILIEAGLVGSDVLGFDAQAKMVRGTRENLAQYLEGGWAVGRADARDLPLRDGTDVDGVVFDAPYGRQSKIAGDLTRVVEGALREAASVTDRAVIVGDRPWARVAHETGWTTRAAFHRQVHQSLTRHIVVLDRE